MCRPALAFFVSAIVALLQSSLQADDVLTPVPAAGAVEVGTEEGTEDGEARAKKAKKHRHKKHREDKHEDWEGDGEERSSSKKKHHSHHHHHKSSRHRRLEQDD